jgi:cyanophycin synthetase
VVKPAAGTGGGLGVTTGIRTRWQLARAAYAAAVHASGGEVIIEQQIEGENYRLLFLDGNLIDATVRRAPAVSGDGRSTVRQLVDSANAARQAQGAALSHGLLRLDMDMRQTLATQGLTLASVVPAGKAITLKTAINENTGDDNCNAMDIMCNAIIKDAAKAVRLTGARLAGVDVITRDPHVSLDENGGVILEVNNPPGFYWHYHQRGNPCYVCEHVLRALLADHEAKTQVDAAERAVEASVIR